MSNSNNNSSADYLANLPYDIISEMVSRMNISTVDSLKREVSYKWDYSNPDNNKYKGVSDACENRKSVVKYLNKHFGDGVALLEAMSKYFVYISGSRSLEFFEEGHVGEDSDWDMYVSTWPGHVIGIMQQLEKLGVTWMSPKDELSDLKASGKGSMVIESPKLEYLLRNQCFAAHGTDMENIIEAVHDNATNNFTVNFDDGQSSVTPNELGDGYTSENICCIIRGKLLHKDKTTRIQLIVESRGNTNASIVAPFTYHSSCVQSFIGPYTACHMYGKLTSEGKSYGWRNNISKKARRTLTEYDPSTVVEVHSVPGWSKYSGRGFEYINPPEWHLGFELRDTQDGHSIWLEYSEHTAAPRDVVMLYTQVSKAVTWFQVAEGTVPVHFPFKATYGYDKLNFGEWFVRHRLFTQQQDIYLSTYIPHLSYKSNTVLTHIGFHSEL
jgi:hypothetical protein